MVGNEMTTGSDQKTLNPGRRGDLSEEEKGTRG